MCPMCLGRGVLPEPILCANERCGREFVWQEGRSEQGQHRSKGVMYCSRACARAHVHRRNGRGDGESVKR